MRRSVVVVVGAVVAVAVVAAAVVVVVGCAATPCLVFREWKCENLRASSSLC